MAESYLIDSNVIIDFTGYKFPSTIKIRLDKIFDQSFHYSIISRMEVLGFNAPPVIIDQLEAFLESGKIDNIDMIICDMVIDIRRLLSKQTDLPDLIIAATAIVHNRVLLTRNIDDFKNIPGLKFENPWYWK